MKVTRSFMAIAFLGAATLLTGSAPASGEITIGGSISHTGRYAEPAGRFVNAYRLFADRQNARGGLLGKKVKLILLDDKSDKQTSIKLYERLITQEKIDFTLGPYSSGITDAVANLFERHEYPTLAPGASSRGLWEKGRKYLFNQNAVAQKNHKGALHLAREVGVKRIAIIGEDSLFPRQSAEGAVEWAKKLGLKVVLNENYPRKQTDFTALLQKIKARRAEALFSNSYFADAAAQIRQLRELNINLKIFAGTIGPGLPKFAEQLGATAEYVLGFSQWEPQPDALKFPGMRELIASYEKRYGVKPSDHVAMAYGAIEVVSQAILKAGSHDRQKVWKTLRASALQTVMGRWKVDENNLNERDGLTFQILDGRRRIVWPKELAEVSYKLPMPGWKDRNKR